MTCVHHFECMQVKPHSVRLFWRNVLWLQVCSSRKGKLQPQDARSGIFVHGFPLQSIQSLTWYDAYIFLKILLLGLQFWPERNHSFEIGRSAHIDCSFVAYICQSMFQSTNVSSCWVFSWEQWKQTYWTISKYNASHAQSSIITEA